MSDAQAAGYQADGFELALHLLTGCADFTPASLESDLDEPARPRSPPRGRASGRRPRTAPTASSWSDWATEPKVERRHGIRFDTNYYYNGPPAG